ncbi:hypothetical protein DENIS_0480 [Desulfonema ishimotonii]|uniref:Uncharacterized protein n=1 Tax=Desulfonema ishimotonii TaxID=45657 RepID=A0A401FRF2_9BACT|nr:hypothetical protein [Desulfonema ishimotonii]GBC59541.1 hypothetical protein DENIS_0480 [Desulfonema ishimotonii]
MSIRMVATELYRLMKEVERLEKALRDAPFEKREALENELRKVRAERNRMRRILDGKKDVSPPARRYR